MLGYASDSQYTILLPIDKKKKKKNENKAKVWSGWSHVATFATYDR